MFKITALVQLCGPYIQSLSIRSLVPTDIPVQRMTSPEMADLVTSQVANVTIKQQVKNGETLLRGKVGWQRYPFIYFNRIRHFHQGF